MPLQHNPYGLGTISRNKPSRFNNYVVAVCLFLTAFFFVTMMIVIAYDPMAHRDAFIGPREFYAIICMMLLILSCFCAGLHREMLLLRFRAMQYAVALQSIRQPINEVCVHMNPIASDNLIPVPVGPHQMSRCPVCSPPPYGDFQLQPFNPPTCELQTPPPAYEPQGH